MTKIQDSIDHDSTLDLISSTNDKEQQHEEKDNGGQHMGQNDSASVLHGDDPPRRANSAEERAHEEAYSKTFKKERLSMFLDRTKSIPDDFGDALRQPAEMAIEQPLILEGGLLRPYQLEGLQWMFSLLENNLNGILADDAGLGKKIQIISMIAFLVESGLTGPHLIVAPRASLSNWVHEFTTWAPSIKSYCYYGGHDEIKVQREELLKEEFHVLITHYDLIVSSRVFLKKFHWFYVVVDEGSSFLMNHESILAKLTVNSGYQIQRRLLLTGTPMQNNLQELWALFNFIHPSIFSSSLNFEEWFSAPFCDPTTVSFSEDEETLIIQHLRQVIKPFILRRTKDQVMLNLDMVILKCDMSSWQKMYYQQIIADGNDEKTVLLNLSLKLLKCCNHPYMFVQDYNTWREKEIVRASGKFELLDRLLLKLYTAGHRVLLMSQMPSLRDILQVFLTLKDYRYIRVDATETTEEGRTLLKEFNDADSPHFAILSSPSARGLGQNLQSTDTVIIIDNDGYPRMNLRAEELAYWSGKKKEVRIFVLVSVGSVGEVILERKGISNYGAFQDGLSTVSDQDAKEIIREIMHRDSSSIGAELPCDRETNLLAARSDEEFFMFEELDEQHHQHEYRLTEEHEVPGWLSETNVTWKSRTDVSDED